MAKKTENRYIVSRRRDGDNSPVYVCCKLTDGSVYSNRIPMDTEVTLDDNIVKSLKGRTEMVRVSAPKGFGKGETLEARPTYNIEKV
jgi:hypothetical protein